MTRHSSPLRHWFDVTVCDRDIVVSNAPAGVTGVYPKSAGEPQLILRQRTRRDDYELVADAWQAANTKARELGWIV